MLDLLPRCDDGEAFCDRGHRVREGSKLGCGRKHAHAIARRRAQRLQHAGRPRGAVMQLGERAHQPAVTHSNGLRLLLLRVVQSLGSGKSAWPVIAHSVRAMISFITSAEPP